ncbi:MAG: NAD(P)/FAD-dependent oxidoreductase [Prevotella sp.]|nr:NAD(P)/FAD-dependent oxidoreductase [Prevotella sp.]
MRTVIIGGGAAGFFLAISLKELMPEMEVTIFERSQRVLSKVEVSGGGRCNCTNSFETVTDLQMVYPRGHRLMKRLFNVFDYHDAYAWFERHGVSLVTQDDECVFPAAQDSHAIINCFLSLAHRYHVNVCLGQKVQSLDTLSEYDYIAVTTGGSPKGEGLRWLRDMGHEIAEPVPSLFTFQINDKSLTSLMGTVAGEASVMIPATKFRAEGPLLITHWGMSGPAILKLSSYAARQLADLHYQMPLSVNWLGKKLADVESVLSEAVIRNSPKQLSTVNPFGLPQRLWNYLLAKSLAARMQIRWSELNKKDANRLVNVLCNDTYEIAGRAAFKDEFVTCGGVSLKSVNPSTLESKMVPNLFFAGEVLDIDGITGGFNFQAAWTTAYAVATAIVGKLS